MTAEWEAYELEEDDIAETITRRDYEEGVAFMRGTLIGLAMSVAPWVGIAAAFVVIYQAIQWAVTR